MIYVLELNIAGIAGEFAEEFPWPVNSEILLEDRPKSSLFPLCQQPCNDL